MLGKLLSSELRALWKPAVVMLAVMVGAGLVGTVCFSASDVLSDGFSSASSAFASNASIALIMATLFCGFLVWASVVALFVFVAMRFYRSMFTDEGYLTLTLPVKTGALVMAKFLVAYVLLLVFILVATLLYSLMAMSVNEVASTMQMLFSLMGGWSAFSTDGGEVLSTVMGVLSMLVTTAYQLALAFGSLALGSWWARRHKVAAAVGVYLGAGWLLSLVFSIAGVLAMTADVGIGSALLSAVGAVQLLVDAALAAGALALTAFLVRRKVDLS